MFHQTNLFDHIDRTARAAALPDLVARVSEVSKRPRYVLLVLNLIARAADTSGRLGPYVATNTGPVPVRDWLSQALAPLATRDCRRQAMIAAVRAQMTDTTSVRQSAGDLAAQQDDEISARILRSGRTNVSRAVSDLIRAGLLQRHYQGYRVDHPNRGAQREAVYTISQEVRAVLGGEPG